jgi:penicillin-binding protein 1A
MIRWLINIIVGFIALNVFGAACVLAILLIYGRDLPDHRQLESYAPAVVTRIHAFNGQLFDEVASEKRIFAPIHIIPQKIINGFIAVEDENFYQHFGINPMSIARAIFQNIGRYRDGKRPLGASTITQQVAKYFLLSNHLSYERKIREAIIAIRLEQALSKDQILELYLNEIYMGRGNYGIAAATLNYFNKGMNELTIAEIAYLASLPKAPNRYSRLPENKDTAITRRNWVIRRMHKLDFISLEEAQNAILQPLGVVQHHARENLKASYFLAEVKKQTKKLFPRAKLSEDGFFIKTTLFPEIQDITTDALRKGLEEYDRRHGWRGPLVSWGRSLKTPPEDENEVHISDLSNPLPSSPLVYRPEYKEEWLARLRTEKPVPGTLPHWQSAVVLTSHTQQAAILLSDGQEGIVTLPSFGYSFLHEDYFSRGEPINDIAAVLKSGDVVLVAQTLDEQGNPLPNHYTLQQIPKINGGALVMNVHTGRVLALQGGWSFEASEFNRATQAQRQVGSSIKPFVYAAAIESGMTPSTLILDAPFVTGSVEERWKPENFSKRFLGAQTMRVGLEKSLNTMTVRLAHRVGVAKIKQTLERFSISENIRRDLSISLGSAESTVMNMAAAYASLINNGHKVEPSVIDKIHDRYGQVVYRLDNRKCDACTVDAWRKQFPPFVPDSRPLIIEQTTAYQITHILKGVIERGTGKRLRYLDIPLAGKTGTTNDKKDTWFFGLTSDWVVGIYIGFDKPQDLGKSRTQETGSTVALPVFEYIVKKIQKQKTLEFSPFRVPSGIRLVRIDRNTGKLASEKSKDTILEAYKIGTEPQKEVNLAQVLNHEIIAQKTQDFAQKQNNRTPTENTPLGLSSSIRKQELIGPVFQPFYGADDAIKSDFSSTIY